MKQYRLDYDSLDQVCSLMRRSVVSFFWSYDSAVLLSEVSLHLRLKWLLLSCRFVFCSVPPRFSMLFGIDARRYSKQERQTCKCGAAVFIICIYLTDLLIDPARKTATSSVQLHECNYIYKLPNLATNLVALGGFRAVQPSFSRACITNSPQILYHCSPIYGASQDPDSATYDVLYFFHSF